MITAAPLTYRSRMAVCANPRCPKPGGRYLRTTPNKSYCSEECRRADRFGTRVCAGCGNEFVPDRPGRIWCSVKCFRGAAN